MPVFHFVTNSNLSFRQLNCHVYWISHAVDLRSFHILEERVWVHVPKRVSSPNVSIISRYLRISAFTLKMATVMFAETLDSM